MRKDLRPTGAALTLWAAVLLAACGGGGGGGAPPLIKQARGTTLERTILPAEVYQMGAEGAYFELGEFTGSPLVTRTDLSRAFVERTERRQALAAFIHLTDIHIIDGQSPLRLPYLRQYAMGTSATGLNFANGYRNQDQFGPYVTEAMLQQIASLGGAPATRRRYDFAVSTGDVSDSKQSNELEAFINLLDGVRVNPDYSGQGYIGVQDDFLPAPQQGGMPGCFVQNQAFIYGLYWHPDPPPTGTSADCWKLVVGFPEYPELLIDGVESFQSTGIGMPWYSGYGNHDALLSGNFPVEGMAQDIFDEFATGTTMLLDTPPNQTIEQFLGCLVSPTVECIEQIVLEAPKRAVPASLERVIFDARAFILAHLASPSIPGPSGHGFTAANLTGPTLYYTFDIAPNIIGIMLDTTNPYGGADGSLDLAQTEWLNEQLIAVHSNYYSPIGQLITTSNPDKLVILFSHHSSETMGNFISPGPTVPRIVFSQFEQLLHLFPNVILWVTGHNHYNRIFAHPDPADRTGGFWEINSASLVEFPQQARSVEIVDNRDGTLSIFAVTLDHAGTVIPAKAPPYTILDIAGISRELGANDFLLGSPPVNLGTEADRNAELLIANPLQRNPPMP